jgi:23S rRNA-/tRNA-specific pseudouridylate synthase
MPTEQRVREFVVTDAAGSTLGSIVAKLAPSDPQAIEQGRVFVEQRRVKDPQYRAEAGAHVTWYLPRPVSGDADDVAFSIVARRGDWVVAAKPSNWTCEPDRTGHSTSLRDAVASELHVSHAHALTRLDVGVSGVVLLGLSHRACSEATKLQDQHLIIKDYFALVAGTPAATETWNGPPCGAREARTQLRVVSGSCVVHSTQKNGSTVSLVSVRPITGRKHQIRIHAAHHGYPLLGDGRYGGPTRVVRTDGSVLYIRRMMLHAYRLTIPWESQTWTVACPPPDDLVGLWSSLGGNASCLRT